MKGVTLEENELFHQLEEVDKKRLAGMAVRRSYATGEIVFRENEEAYAICLLLKGRVGLQMDVGNGRKLTVSTVDPGEFFAWSGLVAPHDFTATARAMEDCETAIWKAAELRELFDENPALGYRVMDQIAFLIAQRLRDSHLQLLGLFGG
ncbi:MAG: cyclic nucleotide-binding domain-containing protein [Thermoleophilia bacterium]|nr:cyclic nucleotide-binding domain-containing protein [Thermoleophilia bacterium]